VIETTGVLFFNPK